MTIVHRIYNVEELKEIHLLSIYNRRKIKKKNHACACFHCQQKFDSSMIIDWCDAGRTAICPFCNVDSVLFENAKFSISDSMLNQMHRSWFSY